MIKTIATFIGLAALATGQNAWAGDVETLRNQVQYFLANVDNKATHASFWAEDLVYTSSAGLRFGKSEIMDGFAVSDPAAEVEQDDSGMTYSGQNIDVRVFGDTAVVVFKLIGAPADGSAALSYFNTGVFLRRNNVWQVVAWQATRIPST